MTIFDKKQKQIQKRNLMRFAALFLFCVVTIPTLASPTYPLKRSANNRYLVDQNNVPFLMMGDSPQSMMGSLTPAQMATYMADRKNHGFNTIYAMAIVGDYIGGSVTGATQDGTPPFSSGSNENNYDFSTPNPAYFAELDNMLNLAASNGLLVLLNPLDTGIGSNGNSWMLGARANGSTKMFNYGAYLGNRYKNFPNIIWHSGNDFQDWNTNSTDNNLVYQVMAGIASTDNVHLQTVELNFNFSYSTQDKLLAPLLDLNGIYTYGGIYDEAYQAYNASPTLPVYLDEANYEYENNTKGLSPWPGGPPQGAPNATYTQVVRLQAWWTLTSGGVGQLYGSHYIWGFADGWQSNLDSPGAGQIQYINSFFNSIPWQNLVPDQTHKVVTSGYGTYNASGLNQLTNNYATTAWVPDGSLAVVYNPQGNALTVNLGVFSGQVTAQWYDPSGGTYSAISSSPLANSGTHTFSIPGNNHSGKPDWVLLLQTGIAASKPSAPTGLTAVVN